MDNYVYNYNEYLFEALEYVDGIRQVHVPATQQNILESLKQILRVSEDDICFVGSSGKIYEKNAISNNINIGLNKSKILKNNNITQEELYEFLENQFKRINTSIEINKEKGWLKFPWPIQKAREKKSVDVLCKLTDNIDWLKFSRHCPLEKTESKYNSKYREALISSIVESAKKDITQYYNNNEVIKTFEEYDYDSEDGLFSVEKTFEGKNGLLKKPIEFAGSRKLITADKNEFTKKIFGENIQPEDLMTFESIFEYVKSRDFPHKKRRKLIFEKLKKKLVGLKLQIPEEIK
jgi:hypothetical protein